MLLCIMLYIMPACLMMFAALSNAACLYVFFFFANAFCFHALSWFIDTLFVYFKHYLASCTMLLICCFFLFYVHTVFLVKGLCALWRNSTYK